MAIYWALYTLTTVGFGDINVGTMTERVFAILWMIVGVALYSYAIGNMTSMLTQLDSQNEDLNQKMSVLKEFKKRTQMPNSMFFKIKRHLENNQKQEHSFDEQEKLMKVLPQQLRS